MREVEIKLIRKHLGINRPEKLPDDIRERAWFEAALDEAVWCLDGAAILLFDAATGTALERELTPEGRRMWAAAKERADAIAAAARGILDLLHMVRDQDQRTMARRIDWDKIRKEAAI